MLKFLGTQSKKDLIEQAKYLRAEPETLKAMAEGMLESGNAFTLFPTRGRGELSGMQVYAGDFSSGSANTGEMGAPLLILDYRQSQHTAYIKSGQGELLMMLVREKSEEPWFDGSRRYVTFGSQTEGRLYLNGKPVGVNYSKEFVDIAPRNGSEERAQVGASLVELCKEKAGNSLRLFKRKGDGTKGQEVAAFTRLRRSTTQSVCVFRLLSGDLLDPVVALVMAWFSATIDMGKTHDPLTQDATSAVAYSSGVGF